MNNQKGSVRIGNASVSIVPSGADLPTTNDDVVTTEEDMKALILTRIGGLTTGKSEVETIVSLAIKDYILAKTGFKKSDVNEINIDELVVRAMPEYARTLNTLFTSDHLLPIHSEIDNALENGDTTSLEKLSKVLKTLLDTQKGGGVNIQINNGFSPSKPKDLSDLL